MGLDSLINIHSVLPSSGINGPGKRMVIFFQGCAHDCPGCFNPDTHPFRIVRLCSPEKLLEESLSPGIEGITVSGGEPFYQVRGLLRLLKKAREDYGLSTVVYTGFLYETLISVPACRSTFEFIDVLVDGRFEEGKREPTLLARGSINQRFYFLTGSYQIGDFYMPAKVEITIGRDGTVQKTGFSKI